MILIICSLFHLNFLTSFQHFNQISATNKHPVLLILILCLKYKNWISLTFTVKLNYYAFPLSPQSAGCVPAVVTNPLSSCGPNGNTVTWHSWYNQKQTANVVQERSVSFQVRARSTAAFTTSAFHPYTKASLQSNIYTSNNCDCDVRYSMVQCFYERAGGVKNTGWLSLNHDKLYWFESSSSPHSQTHPPHYDLQS